MIEFKSPTELVRFLDENLPDKIKSKLFFEENQREYRGKTIIDKTKKSDFFIFDELRSREFAAGITKNPASTYIPEKYILYWTKLQKFLNSENSLEYDIKLLSLLTINQACEFLAVTRPTLYKILREEHIPTVEILSQKKIQLKDLVEYVENKKNT